MPQPRYYRVAIEGDWELHTKDENNKTVKIRAKKGDIFCCYGRKDYSKTRSFDLVDVDADYIQILKRWGRLGKSAERFAVLAASDYSEAKAVVSDLVVNTKYAPKSQKREDLIAFVEALENLKPLPLGKSE